ncbi:MAG: NHL repeat-containing protein [Phycisphaerales bacterium]
MRTTTPCLIGLTVLIGAGVTMVHAQSIDDAVRGQSVLGINQTTGDLVKYDFDANNLTDIGIVQSSTSTMTGIQAAIYFPTFQNIHALWTSPTDNKNKLLHINVADAQATVIAEDVEGGRFTGAAPLNSEAHPYAFFAMQAAKIKPPSTISGLININPGNSSQNEFTCTKSDGSTFSRDDLASNALTLDSSGTYYQGDATLVHVKPKGNGNQNGLTIDGQPYALQNSNTYNFAGSMQVRVYNDKISSGKAMGHWWIQIVSGTVTINDQVQVLTPNRITQVDQKTGTVTEIMPLSRTYTGLATSDGAIFYAMHEGDLYRIDTTLATETEIGDVYLSTPAGMTFVGSYLVIYDQSQRCAVVVDPATARVIASVPGLGAGSLSPIMFAPTPQVVTQAMSGSCD